MQAITPLALLVILIFTATICGCTYDNGNTGPEFGNAHEELEISGPVAISLEESHDLFADFSREYMHRDPAGSIMKIIGLYAGTDGKALYWIFGTVENNVQEYYEVSSGGVRPLIWEIPLENDAIDIEGIVDPANLIMRTGHADGERTITITGREIAITTKTEDGIMVGVFDAYTGDPVI